MSNEANRIYNGYIIPLYDEGIAEKYRAMESGKLAAQILNCPSIEIGETPRAFDMVCEGEHVKVVLFRAMENGTIRERFMQMGSALKLFLGEKATHIQVLTGNAEKVYSDAALLQKLYELPHLVFYRFDAYMSKKTGPVPEVDFFLTESQKEICGQAAGIAEIVAEGTLLARELVNRPAAYMTPQKLAECAVEAGEKAGFTAQVLGRTEIEEIGMKSFLAVSAGAYHEPKFIIMRYNGADSDTPVTAIVGKGITYDSGGYSLKNKDGMVTMHTDMGGAAAVIGTMYVAAKRGLKLNLVGLVPACENLIGPHATLPGAVIGSLLGRTIEVVNTDCEGRLILCDALTYGAWYEKANVMIDIGTLTGGAAMAVGKRSGVVLTEDEELYQKCTAASKASCEKVWRLDMDEELRGDLWSFYADTKNTSVGNNPGGTITAALFLKSFTEGKRWMHIDMAPVGWTTTDELPYAPKGATGYGVALLSELLFRLSEE